MQVCLWARILLDWHACVQAAVRPVPRRALHDAAARPDWRERSPPRLLVNMESGLGCWSGLKDVLPCQRVQQALEQEEALAIRPFAWQGWTQSHHRA